MNIAKLLKSLQEISKFVVGLTGFFFVIMLCMWSVVYIKGGSVENAQLDLRPLITSPALAWVWIGTFTIMVIGMVVWLIKEIRKGIVIARDMKLSNEEKGKHLFWWLLKH